MIKFKDFIIEDVVSKKLFKQLPDYESKKKYMNVLIDKRGDSTSNLSKIEQKEYEILRSWWNENGKD